jgi:hypothetical protein
MKKHLFTLYQPMGRLCPVVYQACEPTSLAKVLVRLGFRNVSTVRSSLLFSHHYRRTACSPSPVPHLLHTSLTRSNALTDFPSFPLREQTTIDEIISADQTTPRSQLVLSMMRWSQRARLISTQAFVVSSSDEIALGRTSQLLTDLQRLPTEGLEAVLGPHALSMLLHRLVIFFFLADVKKAAGDFGRGVSPAASAVATSYAKLVEILQSVRHLDPVFIDELSFYLLESKEGRALKDHGGDPKRFRSV